jgi:hypothetical protein
MRVAGFHSWFGHDVKRKILACTGNQIPDVQL